MDGPVLIRDLVIHHLDAILAWALLGPVYALGVGAWIERRRQRATARFAQYCAACQSWRLGYGLCPCGGAR